MNDPAEDNIRHAMDEMARSNTGLTGFALMISIINVTLKMYVTNIKVVEKSIEMLLYPCKKKVINMPQALKAIPVNSHW